MRITLQVNGAPRQAEKAPDDSLLTALRDALDLTGTGIRIRALPMIPHGLPAPTSHA